MRVREHQLCSGDPVFIPRPKHTGLHIPPNNSLTLGVLANNVNFTAEFMGGRERGGGGMEEFTSCTPSPQLQAFDMPPLPSLSAIPYYIFL